MGWGYPFPTSTISFLGVYVELQQLVIITFDLCINRERDIPHKLAIQIFAPVIMISVIFTPKIITSGIKRELIVAKGM